MEEIELNCLTMEITRKCNMQPVCAHCLRGNPQNIELSTDVVDNILSQVDTIAALVWFSEVMDRPLIGWQNSDPYTRLRAETYECVREYMKKQNIRS